MIDAQTMVPTTNGPKQAKDITTADTVFSVSGEPLVIDDISHESGESRLVRLSNIAKISASDSAMFEVTRGEDRTVAAARKRQNRIDMFHQQTFRSQRIAAGNRVTTSKILETDSVIFSDGTDVTPPSRACYQRRQLDKDSVLGALFVLYGRLSSPDSYILSNSFDINSTIEHDFLEALKKLKIDVTKSANGSQGKARRYRVSGLASDDMLGFGDITKANISSTTITAIVKHFGNVSKKRAQLLGLEFDGFMPSGNWLISNDTVPYMFESHLDDSYISSVAYGFTLASGHVKNGSPTIWASSGMSTIVADKFTELGFKCSVLMEENSNSYKFNIHLPARFGVWSNIVSGSNPEAVREGILLGSIVVDTGSGFEAYVRPSEAVTTIMGDPQSIDETSGYSVYRLDSSSKPAITWRTPYTNPLPMFYRGRQVATAKSIFAAIGEGTHQGNYSDKMAVTPAVTLKLMAVHKRPDGVMVQPSREVGLCYIDDLREDVAAIVKNRVGQLAPSADEPTYILSPSQISSLMTTSLSKPSIAMHSALKYPDEDSIKLPIHPYVLGAWLGDGHFNSGYICGEDKELFTYIESIGYSVKYLSDVNRITGKTFYIASVTDKESDMSLYRLLNKNGYKFAKTSKTGGKRIPEVYFHAPFDDRLQMLKGMMDTDGCYSGELVSSYPLLAQDMLRLTRELGFRVTFKTNKRATYSYQGEKREAVTSRLMIHAANDIFQLDRKAQRHTVPNQRRYLGDRHFTYVGKPEKCSLVSIVTKEPFLAGSDYIPIISSGLK